MLSLDWSILGGLNLLWDHPGLCWEVCPCPGTLLAPAHPIFTLLSPTDTSTVCPSHAAWDNSLDEFNTSFATLFFLAGNGISVFPSFPRIHLKLRAGLSDSS